jgi:hypothetical protein
MKNHATQFLLGFEQARIDAELDAEHASLQAKLAAKAQRAIQQHQAELDKMSRRLARQWAQQQRTP